MQNTIVKEFENNPNVVTFIYDQGGLRGETLEWCKTMWSNYFLRGQVVFEADGSIATRYYKQPNTGLPFGRGFIIDQNGKVALPYFGHDPQMVIAKIYELLGESKIRSEEPRQGMDYRLYQNTPNPFNPTTTIAYSIAETSRVQLRIFNNLGQQVAMLVDEVQQPGEYKKELSTQNLADGIYFYQLRAGNYAETRKMILLQ